VDLDTRPRDLGHPALRHHRGSPAFLALAIDGCRRLQKRVCEARRPVPFGALVVLALPPFWDFSTSGMECGLIFGWIGASWWGLCALSKQSELWKLLALAFLLGLGELVRPDLALFSAIFAFAAWYRTRPSRRRLAALWAVALAIPLAYEVFRAGYYGVLLPNTAIAKEASALDFRRGLVYLFDFAAPYNLGVPCLLALLVALPVWRARRSSPAPCPRCISPLSAVTSCTRACCSPRCSAASCRS
jgi:arabinofuranosyltransferase